MAIRILKVFLIIFLFISCSSKREEFLTGSDQELYNLIIKEINKEKKYVVLNHTDFELLEDMITTLQIRFPYSPYTREAYLLSADVAFKRGRYNLAIREYKEFLNNQVNHPKTDYATFKLLKSHSLLISAKDKNIDPAKQILSIYGSLSAVYKSTEYMDETNQIYKKAKRFLLKRAIYVARFYVKKEEYESALGRLKNTEILIPNLLKNSSEAQYLTVLCQIKTLKEADKVTLISLYKKRFPDSKFIDELNNLL